MINSSFEFKKRTAFKKFWKDEIFHSVTPVSSDCFKIADKCIYVEYDYSPTAIYFANKLRNVLYHAPKDSVTRDSLHIKVLSSENRSSFIHELNGRQVRNRFLYEDLDSSSVSIGIESNGTVISLYDRNSNSAVILLAVNSTSLTEQYLAAPLRFIFEEYFRRTSYMLIHAGGLMVDDQVTLFVGPSGQGKSTTVAAGLLAGLIFLGDDYLIVQESLGQFNCFPLYASLKTDYTLGETEHVLYQSAHCAESLKRIFYLKNKSTIDFRRVMKINRIIVPVVTKQSETIVERIGEFRITQALLPSTLLQSHIVSQSKAEKLKRLIRTAEYYQMNVGENIHKIANTIVSLASLE